MERNLESSETSKECCNDSERGDRRAKREHVIKLAEYLHQDEKEMLTLWLADKVLDAVGDDELSKDAITVAQEHIQK